MKTREIILVLFFGLQVVGIVYSRLVPERYFSWAPYDQLSVYSIQVEINGEKLTSSEINSRYNLPATGKENRAISNLIGVIREYELRYGLIENAKVELSYRTNSKPEEIWKWPEL